MDDKYYTIEVDFNFTDMERITSDFEKHYTVKVDLTQRWTNMCKCTKYNSGNKQQPDIEQGIWLDSQACKKSEWQKRQMNTGYAIEATNIIVDML